MRKARKKLRAPIGDFVAIMSRRRCCFCWSHGGDFSIKAGQLSHIDRDRTNDSHSNLAYLCLPHHNEYDSGTSQAKGLTPGELRASKKALEDEVVRLLPKIEAPDTSERRPPAIATPGAPELPGRPSRWDVEQYRRDLVEVGAGFILPRKASAFLRNLRDGAGPEVRRMVEHGHFTDESSRELLVLPPNSELLVLIEAALLDMSKKRGVAGVAARDMRKEIVSYRLAISEGSSERSRRKKS